MSIQEQVGVLSELVGIMRGSAAAGSGEMCCEFDHEIIESGWAVGSKYSFVKDGVRVSELLDDPGDEVPKLVHQLHSLMKAHTGGDWKSFVLTIDAAGMAHTKFVY